LRNAGVVVTGKEVKEGNVRLGMGGVGEKEEGERASESHKPG
jgi:hypothetical protein